MAKRRVLVADDSPMLRAVMRKVLESTGAEVRMVENGERALAAVHDSTPDLIVLDSRMPVMDGLTACRTLKADRFYCRVPVIIISAERPAEPCGADRYVVKDPSFVSLVAAMDELLTASRSRLPVRGGPGDGAEE